MENLKQSRPFTSREEFIRFVREVSPQADVTSVLLFGQFHRVSHLLEHAAERNLERVGLSWAKFRLLMNLMHVEKHHGEGMQPSELSERQDISRNTVSVLISSLEKDGLISRELHSEDRRRFVIRLTTKGRTLLHEQLADQFQFVASRFDLFNAKERQVLLDQLTRLHERLSEKPKPCESS